LGSVQEKTCEAKPPVRGSRKKKPGVREAGRKKTGKGDLPGEEIFTTKSKSIGPAKTRWGIPENGTGKEKGGVGTANRTRIGDQGLENCEPGGEFPTRKKPHRTACWWITAKLNKGRQRA